MDKLKRFDSLEFLRFFMAIGVCYAHLVPTLANYFQEIDFQTQILQSAHGMKAVIAFFIISGFFLKTDGTLFDFISKKVIRLWPVLAFAALIHISCIEDIFSLGFLQIGLGIVGKTNANAPNWYVCVLFWGLICFYLFLKNTDKKKQTLPLILCSYFSFFLVCHGGGRLYSDVIYNIFTRGTLAGIYGISTGILLRRVWEYCKVLFDNIKFEKLIFTIFELALLPLFIYLSMFCKGVVTDLIYLTIFISLFFALLLQKGLISKALAFLKPLGRYSYSIYMIHFPCFYYMKKLLWYNMGGYNKYAIILISIAIVTLVGVGVYHLIEVPFGKLLKRIYEKVKLRLENANNGGDL